MKPNWFEDLPLDCVEDGTDCFQHLLGLQDQIRSSAKGKGSWK